MSIIKKELEMSKREYLKKIPKFYYLLLHALGASTILLALSHYAKTLGSIGELLIMLVCSWYIVFSLVSGLHYQRLIESHVNLVLADNLQEELSKQLKTDKRPLQKITPYIYGFIIIIIVQYGWFHLELPGAGQLLMTGFIFLVVTFELFRSYQNKKQVKWIQKVLEEMIMEEIKSEKDNKID